jgi:hypothetical protein
MIQAILNQDRREDVAGDNVEFGHLRVCFLLQSHFVFFFLFFFFANVTTVYFPPTFCFLQLKSITDTCYGAPVGSLTVLPIPRFGPAQDADDGGHTEAGAAQPVAGPRVPSAAAAATFAAGASASTAAGGAPGPSTFHDPSGHGPHNSSPPVFYEYPSLRTAFSQRLSDLVGRSRKEDALAILKEFDKSTKRA